MVTPEPIWDDNRFFGSGPCRSWSAGTLYVSRMPEPLPDEGPKLCYVAPILAPAKPVEKPAKVVRQAVEKKPAEKKAHRRTRRSIVPRDRATCDHMEDGAPIWTKDGTENHGARRQRYKCGSCLTTGFIVDGVVVAVAQAPKLVPDFPADMDSFLADTAKSKDVTVFELFGKSREQRIVNARRYICMCLRSRNLTMVQIGKALKIPSTTAQYLLSSGGVE